MVTVDDVAGAVGARIAATANFATALPGGQWFDRGPDTPDAYPYLVFRLETTEKGVNSGALYHQAFTCRVGVYVPIGVSGGVTCATAEQFVNSALGTTAANTAMQASTLRNTNDKVLHCLPRTDAYKFDQSLRDGRDIFLTGGSFEILVQGDRSVS